MQYEITLPADYDMGIIRDRVATKGHLLDDFDGLALKAYLVRERDVDGSPVNQYAPFYLWQDTRGMNRFLWGGAGFAGIISSFGRPPVKHWTGVAAQAGPARDGTPVTATRQTTSIPDGADPETAVDGALGQVKDLAATDGVFVSALAVDPRTWEIVQLTLWDRPAAAASAGTQYTVLHTSSPHLQTVDRGRTW